MTMRVRPHWASVALVLILVAVAGLFLAGRLEFHWRRASQEASLGHKADKEAHGDKDKHADKGEHSDEDGRVRGDKVILDAESVKASAIRTAPVQRGAVGVSMQVTGEVRVPDERVANVTARVAGVVREIHKARGATVTAGEPLATVESADLAETRSIYDVALADLAVAEANARAWEARRRQSFSPASQSPGELGWVELDQAIAEHASAVTERTLAERGLARMKELHDRGLRSRTELLVAEADHQRATSRVEATARRLTVLGTVSEVELKRARQRVATARSKMAAAGGDVSDASRTEPTNRFVVRSPIAGVVSDREITLGETVEPTKKIFAIADLSEVWITAALYDKDLAAVRQGMAAVVRVQGVPDVSFKGRVVQIGPQIDEKTRTLPVRIAVKNQTLSGAGERFALRPGMFASVDLETSRKGDVLVVPLAAVQTLDGKSVVFVETVLTDGAAFQRRAVVLGARDGDVVEVAEGLQPGERVVVANAYLLKSELERAKIGGGHGH